MAQAADFFVSYTHADRTWAEWIAWQLEGEGYTIVLQAWDFRPGSDFVQQMHHAVQEAQRTIAVLSPAYLDSAFGGAEWRAVFAKDPTGERGLLLPVRVEVAVVVRALELAEALEAERDHVVAATRQERDRLRRDLHDGLGPSLSGSALGCRPCTTPKEPTTRRPSTSSWPASARRSPRR